MHRLAAIDVGSNTLRLLVAEGPAFVLRPTRVLRRITRLGEGFLPSKKLQPAAMARSIAALKEFVGLMNLNGVEAYLAGATAVVREASNNYQFLDMVEDQVGLRIRILSGREEARLSHLGVASIIPPSPSPTAIFDVGGGSTELSWNKAAESLSLPIGVVHLTETFLQQDPPGADACRRLRQHVEAVIALACFPINTADMLWVGTAGTVTTLASMCLELQEYDPDRINGLELEKNWLLSLSDRLAAMSISERCNLPGLESGREDIILAGALVIVELMETLGFSRFTVSDAGLLEGLFLELCQDLSSDSENRREVGE